MYIGIGGPYPKTMTITIKKLRLEIPESYSVPSRQHVGKQALGDCIWRVEGVENGTGDLK